MDIFTSKDERLANLEKRLNDLDKKMDKSFSRMDESFETFRKIVFQMQKENAELKKDNEFLMEKYKEFIKGIDFSPITQPVKSVTEPIKKEFHDTSRLINDMMLEDMDIEPQKKNAEDLFELVMKRKKISSRAAAKELGLREDRVRYFASKLQKQNLIDANKNFTDLRKK